jgi:hypothetical protein
MPTRIMQSDAAAERFAEVVTMHRTKPPMSRTRCCGALTNCAGRLARLEADIRLLDKRMAEMVAANPALAQRYQLLISMPGVGRFR